MTSVANIDVVMIEMLTLCEMVNENNARNDTAYNNFRSHLAAQCHKKYIAVTFILVFAFSFYFIITEYQTTMLVNFW